MSVNANAGELERVCQERDLYRRLLELDRHCDLEILLGDALALVAETTGAQQGYIELYDDRDEPDRPRWSTSCGFSESELDDVRYVVSRGIVAESVATGRTVATAAAFLDPRFNERESVLRRRIGSVLCVPIGGDPPRGVVYLQRPADEGAFPKEDHGHVELFARHLVHLVDHLLVRSRQVVERDALRQLREKLMLDGVVGRSAALGAALQQAALVAPLDVNVLITGESGTGKSQLARIIHDNSPRARHPFLEINCAALPENLIESELFGALAGAHSTAARAMEGKVRAADGGTLLLDEISELPLAAQAKLLQLLQSRQYFPLGSARPVEANVRVIAATNVDLRAAVDGKRFREDLFYRLQVLPIRVPTLRERSEDIAELAAFFCKEACVRHRLPLVSLSGDAVRALEAAEWPGHVRQLAHTVEAAVIRASGSAAKEISRSHVFEAVKVNPSERGTLSFQAATQMFQMEHLRRILDETGWNVSETARLLDLSRSHVHNLIRGFGLRRTT